MPQSFDSRSKLRVLFVAAVVAALAACGGGDSSEPVPAPEPAPAPAPSPAPAPAPPPALEPAPEPPESSQQIRLLVGDGASLGNVDGAAHKARFGAGSLTAVGGPDGTVIIADHAHGTIRRLDRAGNVRTVHRFDGEIELWADPQTGQAFVTEFVNSQSSRLVTWGADDVVVTVATLWGGVGPHGVTIFTRTPDGAVWYFDAHGRLLKQLANGQIAQVGGGFSITDGWLTATAAAADSAGNVHVRTLSRLSTFAPDGALLSQWPVPGGGTGLAVVGGTQLWVSGIERDGDSRIARVRLRRMGSDGSFEPIGPLSPGFDFYGPGMRLVGATSDGRLLVAGNGAIMQFHDNAWSLLAGSAAPSSFWAAPPVRVSESGHIVFDGQAYTAQGEPLGPDFVPHLTTTLCFNNNFMANIWDPGHVWRVTGPAEADRTTVPVTVPEPEVFCPRSVWQSASGRIYVMHGDRTMTPDTLSERLPDGTLRRISSIPATSIWSMIGSGDERWLYLVDGGQYEGSGRSARVLRVDLITGAVDTLAGAVGSERVIVDGVGDQARFVGPTLHAVDADGNIYLTDSPMLSDSLPATVRFPSYRTNGPFKPRNTIVRRISPITGETKTLAGSLDLYGYRAGPVPGSLPPIDSLAVDAQGVVYAASGPSVIRIEAP